MRTHFAQNDPTQPGGAAVTGGLRDFLLGPHVWRNNQRVYNQFTVLLLDLGIFLKLFSCVRLSVYYCNRRLQTVWSTASRHPIIH
jgi:hypothetical protein